MGGRDNEHTGLVGAFPKVRVELHGSEVGSFVGDEHEHEVHAGFAHKVLV